MVGGMLCKSDKPSIIIIIKQLPGRVTPLVQPAAQPKLQRPPRRPPKSRPQQEGRQARLHALYTTLVSSRLQLSERSESEVYQLSTFQNTFFLFPYCIIKYLNNDVLQNEKKVAEQF